MMDQRITRTLAPLALLLVGIHATPSAAQSKKGIQVIVRPILVQTPIFGANIDLPKLPTIPPGGGIGGDDGTEVSGKTDVSLNTAYMAGVEVRADRWFAEVAGTLADVSATRTLPRAELDTNTRLYGARGGVRVFHHLFATGSVERFTSDITATLALQNGNTITGSTSPGLWDPMIGAAWRSALGDHLDLELSFEGGGFGVGADVKTAGGAVVDWRIAGPLQIRFGWTGMYYKLTLADVSIGAYQRTFVSKQTLQGPVIGIGLVF